MRPSASSSVAWAVLFAVSLVVSACADARPPDPPTASSTPTGVTTPTPSPSDGPVPTGDAFAIRTFAFATDQDGIPIGCDTVGVQDPVFGHLAGSLPIVGPDAIWLEAPDGARLSIVWPAGSTLRFDPDPVLRDPSGVVVARRGDAVMLQVSRNEASGTFEDPYVASGILLAGDFTPDDLSSGIAFQGCYPRILDVGQSDWWLDPAIGVPGEDATAFDAVLRERSCASGTSPEGRVQEPVIEYQADAVVISIGVEHRSGGQDCQGNPDYPIRIQLSEPLGDRRLLDGSSTPPRDATLVP